MRLSVSFHPVCYDKLIAKQPESSCSGCCCTEARIPFRARRAPAWQARPDLGCSVTTPRRKHSPLRLLHQSLAARGDYTSQKKNPSLCETAARYTSPLSSLRCPLGQIAAHTAGTGAGSSLRKVPRGGWPSVRLVLPGRSRGVNADCPRPRLYAVYAEPKASDIYQALTGKVDGESVAGGGIYFF